MPPLDSFQYGIGRQVVHPSSDDPFTVRGRINTGDGAFLILSPSDAEIDIGVLVPESHVRDTWNAVARETDAASLGQSVGSVNPAVQTATDQRLDRLESLIISVLERDRVDSAEDQEKVDSAEEAPAPPTTDAVPPAPAPSPGTDGPDGTGSSPPIVAPGPAAPSTPAPGAPVPGAEPATPPAE